MLPVLSAAQMRAADRHTIEVLGVPGRTLMESAGNAVAQLLSEEFRDARLAVLCGRGNNGGDGLVVARRACSRRQRSRRPLVLLFGRADQLSADAREQLLRFESAGGEWRELLDEDAWQAALPEVLQCGVIVDALIGTGLRAEPTGLVGRVIRDLAACPSRPPIVAVDLPSGLCSDDGHVRWPALAAHATVTFAAPKCGHVLPPACERVGRLIVADIGIPREVCEAGVQLWLLEAADAALAWPGRAPSAHKGSFGHLLVLGGSVGKTGAVALAAHAALRGGTGLVTAATVAPALALLVSQAWPELMSATVGKAWSSASVERALELATGCDAVVLGPGLGQGPGEQAFVRAFVERCEGPLLVDADGLNALAGLTAWPARKAASVLTPHPGEMGRLLGSSSAHVQSARLESALALAAHTGTHVVLKGQRTLVADPAGRAAVNPTGNPGLATAGSGDVLAGLVGGLLARGSEAWEAATAGVYLHGLAADLVARRLGQEALVAGDLIAALPDALRALREGS